VTGWWFSPGTPVSSINKTDRQDITEILLKVELNTITLTHFRNVPNMTLKTVLGFLLLIDFQDGHHCRTKF
jgi:hypothetical protein